MAEVEAAVGRGFGDAVGSLARQRPVGGAGVDARDDGHDPRPRYERRNRGRAGARLRQRGVRSALSRAVRGQLPVDRRRDRRPRRPVAPAATGRRGGLPVLEQRPCPRVSREGGDRRRSRDRGHRAGDGLREPRSDLGDRRPVHPQPGDGRANPLRRRDVRRAGRGRRRRDARDRADRRPRRATAGRRRRAARARVAARASLRRPVRHRVHDRGRPAVDAPGPGRQAQPAGRAPDRGRHGRGRDVSR